VNDKHLWSGKAPDRGTRGQVHTRVQEFNRLSMRRELFPVWFSRARDAVKSARKLLNSSSAQFQEGMP